MILLAIDPVCPESSEAIFASSSMEVTPSLVVNGSPGEGDTVTQVLDALFVERIDGDDLRFCQSCVCRRREVGDDVTHVSFPVDTNSVSLLSLITCSSLTRLGGYVTRCC